MRSKEDIQKGIAGLELVLKNPLIMGRTRAKLEGSLNTLKWVALRPNDLDKVLKSVS